MIFLYESQRTVPDPVLSPRLLNSALSAWPSSIPEPIRSLSASGSKKLPVRTVLIFSASFDGKRTRHAQQPYNTGGTVIVQSSDSPLDMFPTAIQA